MKAVEGVAPANIENLIESNKGFIIKVVSRITGRYVSVYNDDAFAVGLEAFAEALERFDEERGNFFSYANLVIESRLKTYLEKKNRESKVVSLDSLYEEGVDFIDKSDAEWESGGFMDEVQEYKEKLKSFNLTLEQLADEAPKHKDTRERGLKIAKLSSSNEQIVEATYTKKKLPIRDVARFAKVTEKIVKGSRKFILAALIIFVEKYPALYRWINGEG